MRREFSSDNVLFLVDEGMEILVDGGMEILVDGGMEILVDGGMEILVDGGMEILVDGGMEILVDEEMEIGSIKATKSRSIQASKAPTIECLLGSFVIFQGIRTSIAKKPIYHIYINCWLPVYRWSVIDKQVTSTPPSLKMGGCGDLYLHY